MPSIRYVLAAQALLAWLPLHAAEPLPAEQTVTWYDVEIVVFRNLETRSTESWPTDAGAPAVAEATPLFPPSPREELADADQPGTPDTMTQVDPLAAASSAQAPAPYEPLDTSAHQLAGLVASLERSSLYEPILHVAWTQPPLDRSEAPYLRITLPDAMESEDAEPESAADGNEMAVAEDAPPVPSDIHPDFNRDAGEAVLLDELPEGAEALLDDETRPQFARPLDGVIQLSVSRYLHLDVDLLYLPDDLNLAVLDDIPAATREWTEEDRLEREQRQRAIIEALARGDITLEEAEILSLEPEQQVFEGFRLNQFRRLRSREIHYFDHPVYGLIVTVTPREVPARTLEGVGG